MIRDNQSHFSVVVKLFVDNQSHFSVVARFSVGIQSYFLLWSNIVASYLVDPVKHYFFLPRGVTVLETGGSCDLDHTK